jgi:hypothetical protein
MNPFICLLLLIAVVLIFLPSGKAKPGIEPTENNDKLDQELRNEISALKLLDSFIKNQIENNGSPRVGMSFLRKALETVRSTTPREECSERYNEYEWCDVERPCTGRTVNVKYTLYQSGKDDLALWHWGRTCKEFLVIRDFDRMNSERNVRELPSPSVYHTHLDEDAPIPESYGPIIREIREHAKKIAVMPVPAKK